ncbi:hypothetical protein MUB52_11030 [Roseobacter sp. WL0113]|uniref:Uncharacterized protein n=2 Tax=Roseobacter sinensis TaxID=2931391 RepID=A0ABT3BEF3_9RHOB|nr:hypothetical protein [Roseobacter sp. WL0113]
MLLTALAGLAALRRRRA